MIIEHNNDEEKLLPTILEIPAKDSPYDPTKDTMLVAAAAKLFGMEAGLEKLKNMDDWKTTAQRYTQKIYFLL